MIKPLLEGMTLVSFILAAFSTAVWVSTGVVGQTMWYQLFFILCLGFSGILQRLK